MTSHIEEARKALSDSDGWNNNAKAHALIAIAVSLEQIHSQLQLANRIAVAQDTLLENSGYRDLDGIMLPRWKPEIAELLGVKE